MISCLQVLLLVSLESDIFCGFASRQTKMDEKNDTEEGYIVGGWMWRFIKRIKKSQRQILKLTLCFPLERSTFLIHYIPVFNSTLRITWDLSMWADFGWIFPLSLPLDLNLQSMNLKSSDYKHLDGKIGCCWWEKPFWAEHSMWSHVTQLKMPFGFSGNNSHHTDWRWVIQPIWFWHFLYSVFFVLMVDA